MYNWNMILHGGFDSHGFDGYLELPALGVSFQGHHALCGPQLPHTTSFTLPAEAFQRPTTSWICACPQVAILSTSVNNLNTQGSRGKTTLSLSQNW